MAVRPPPTAVAGVPLGATKHRSWGRPWERPYAAVGEAIGRHHTPAVGGSIGRDNTARLRGCHCAPPYAALGGAIESDHTLGDAIGRHHMLRLGVPLVATICYEWEPVTHLFR